MLPAKAATWHWRAEVPVSILPAGRGLVVEDREPFVLHYGVDGWGTIRDRAAAPLGLGMFGVRVDADELRGVRELRFARFYRSTDRWEGRDHLVTIAPPVTATMSLLANSGPTASPTRS